jgi:uncharacterized membrane protein (DUF373 family)
MVGEQEHKEGAKRILNRTFGLIIYVMSGVMVLLLLGYLYAILRQLPDIVSIGDKHFFDTMITQVLTFFVLIELVRAFTEYIEFKRVRLYIMAELAAIFILREILIILYAQEIDPIKLISLSLLLISVAVVRTFAIVYNPTKN